MGSVKVGRWRLAEVDGAERHTLVWGDRIMATVAWNDQVGVWDLSLGDELWQTFSGLSEAFTEGERATRMTWAWRSGPHWWRRVLVLRGQLVGTVGTDPAYESGCGWVATWRPGGERLRDCGQFDTDEAAVEAVEAAARDWARGQRRNFHWTDWANGLTDLECDHGEGDDPGGIGCVWPHRQPGGRWKAEYRGAAIEPSLESDCDTREQAKQLVEDWAGAEAPVEVRQGQWPHS